MVNQTMDIYTLGAVPPYNQLLAGKLAVYAASRREIREAYQERYSDAVTEIEERILPANLVLLTTTSAFGRSSMYNRIRYRGREVAQRLGETTGYGNVRLNAVGTYTLKLRNSWCKRVMKTEWGLGEVAPKKPGATLRG